MSVNSDSNGAEPFTHFATKIWELVPNNIKPLDSLSEFKNAVKLWKPVCCPCRIFRIYIPQIDFV